MDAVSWSMAGVFLFGPQLLGPKLYSQEFFNIQRREESGQLSGALRLCTPVLKVSLELAEEGHEGVLLSLGQG